MTPSEMAALYFAVCTVLWLALRAGMRQGYWGDCTNGEYLLVPLVAYLPGLNVLVAGAVCDTYVASWEWWNKPLYPYPEPDEFREAAEREVEEMLNVDS